MLLADGPAVEPGDLPLPTAAGVDAAAGFPERLFTIDLPAARRELVASFERAYLRRVLARTGGRMAEAAALAGVDVRTVRAKLEEHGLDRRTFRPG